MRTRSNWNSHPLLVGRQNGAATLENTSVVSCNFIFIYLFIYFWLCWVFGSCEGPLQLRQVGATPHRGAGTAPHRGARAPHHRGPSRCGAQAPDAQAQQLWPTGPASPRHVGSSQTRARTHVPCTSRQTLNHCATREALGFFVFCFFHLGRG